MLVEEEKYQGEKACDKRHNNNNNNNNTLILSHFICFALSTLIDGNRGSSFSTLTKLRDGQPGNRSMPIRDKRLFLFSKTSRPSLGPTQPPVQWIVGLFPGGKAAGA